MCVRGAGDVVRNIHVSPWVRYAVVQVTGTHQYTEVKLVIRTVQEVCYEENARKPVFSKLIKALVCSEYLIDRVSGFKI
jgi:hypothetical protein